jgi:hypothetical protein
MSYNEIRVPTCRSGARACPEGQAAGGAAALISYMTFDAAGGDIHRLRANGYDLLANRLTPGAASMKRTESTGNGECNLLRKALTDTALSLLSNEPTARRYDKA